MFLRISAVFFGVLALACSLSHVHAAPVVESTVESVAVFRGWCECSNTSSNLTQTECWILATTYEVGLGACGKVNSDTQNVVAIGQSRFDSYPYVPYICAPRIFAERSQWCGI
jgi:hypothetical protein